MYSECPICGNGIWVSKQRKFGRCEYCSSSYHVIRLGKKIIKLEEAAKGRERASELPKQTTANI